LASEDPLTFSIIGFHFHRPIIIELEMSSPAQEPVAIVGFACRLPGQSTNPHKLWDLLERGGIASNKVPKSRFNIDGHWDGSLKPRTMRPLGGMFLEDTDPADFDASFFEISKSDAISMDPNQRQMLEVVFEGLENSGITLESLDGAPVGCFVGSFASGMSFADRLAFFFFITKP
jgi:acyl transferase domain-containing protein